MKLDTLLVPLDGSTLAEGALTCAGDLARDAHARLILVRATTAHGFGSDPTEAQVRAINEAETYLDEVAARMRTLGVTNVQSSVWYGPAAPAIVDAAALNHADLIVMMTHGRSGLGRLVMGSVAESVLRGTTTPILLMRADSAPTEAPTGSALATAAYATTR